MIILNGIVLNHSMQWVERYHSQDVGQEVRRTITGRVAVFSAPQVGGRSITLLATEDSGWLTKEVVDYMLSFASVPGAVYPLIFRDESYAVMFRHNDPPAVDMTPLIYRHAAQGTDFLIGQIKLITV